METIKFIGSIILSLAFGVLTAYLFWVVLLNWLFSFVKGKTVAAAIYKLLCIILVGYVGGIAVPIVVMIGVFYLIAKFMD